MTPNPQHRVVKPELLAPAGDWTCVRAAVENGADAVYFGLDRFNARMRASNFTEKDLPILMDYLHNRSVRGYVTFNTLVFTHEIQEAREYLRNIIECGVDAAIVQDIGVCRLIRSISPDFPIHASTQMTLTSAAGVRFAQALGCHLAVMARECSISELSAIKKAIDAQVPSATSPGAFPLEIFVHGALCVAYSGQCLTSEALGGRSANRGECAQACRMPYDLISDGKILPLGDKRYLLSPQDLAGIDLIPEIFSAGIHSLKIEGRLKSPEYVANITRVYRKAIDETYTLMSQKMEAGNPAENTRPKTSMSTHGYNLEMAFSRGLHTGWLNGIDNQLLVHARFGKKRGVRLGTVSRVGQDRIQIRLENPVQPGDGVVFDAGRPDEKEEGGRIRFVDQETSIASLGFLPNTVNWKKIAPGQIVWKTSDPVLDRHLRKSFETEKIQFQRPVQLRVQGRSNEPLYVEMTDQQGITVRTKSAISLEPAHSQPLTEEVIRKQLGRLGGTPFVLDEVQIELDGNLMMPVSELNRMRRDLVDQLTQKRKGSVKWSIHPDSNPLHWTSHENLESTGTVELIPLVRDLDQLKVVLEEGMACVYCDFEDPKKYRAAVELARMQSPAPSIPKCEVFVAAPRIFKTGEEWILNQVKSSGADGFLIRNYDHLEFFHDKPCRADFSFNVANPITADHLMKHYRLERLTASYDLNATQLLDLVEACPRSWLEITLHQHMPMFHMEHCVFCAFLSNGKDYRDCGRPCDKHKVALKDRVGLAHPLKPDAGCRNTVFNARAQTGAEHFQLLASKGARYFRIEFVDESPAEVKNLLQCYRQLIDGTLSGQELWKRFRLQNQLGVTRGTMEKQSA